MATDALIGGVSLLFGNGADPEVFAALEEVTELSSLGAAEELVKVTHFASNGSKEYIAGLSDGKEFTVTCNQVIGAAQQTLAKTNSGKTGNVRVLITNGTTTETYNFAAVNMGWELAPSVSDKNSVTFTFKITGAITQS